MLNALIGCSCTAKEQLRIVRCAADVLLQAAPWLLGVRVCAVFGAGQAVEVA